jgi:hypothetical protein
VAPPLTWAFTGTIRHGIQVDAERDATRPGLLVGDQEAQTREQQEDRHERESDQQERATAESVDGEDGGDGEEEVDEAESERCEESRGLGEACGGEDGGGVVAIAESIRTLDHSKFRHV